MAQKAVVLLSGGLDSSTACGIAKKNGHEIIALTFRYGQRHEKEIESAKKISEHYGAVEHLIVEIDLSVIGGSALTDKSIDVPSHSEKEIGQGEIPVTYVPGRNTIFLSYALALAEARGADYIYIGANAVDYSGYPDCRPEYIEAFQRVADLGTKRGVEGRPIKIVAPLINLTKAEIIKLGTEIGVPYEKTWSCYLGGEKPCGKCDSCLLRAKGFREAGIPDPLLVKGWG